MADYLFSDAQKTTEGVANSDISKQASNGTKRLNLNDKDIQTEKFINSTEMPHKASICTPFVLLNYQPSNTVLKNGTVALIPLKLPMRTSSQETQPSASLPSSSNALWSTHPSTTFAGFMELHTKDYDGVINEDQDSVIMKKYRDNLDEIKKLQARISELQNENDMLLKKCDQNYIIGKQIDNCLKNTTTRPPPKSGAQRNRECRARKKLLKNTTAITANKKHTSARQPKSDAQRSKEYRERKKKLRQVQASTEGVNLSQSEVTVGKNSRRDESYGTVEEDLIEASNNFQNDDERDQDDSVDCPSRMNNLEDQLSEQNNVKDHVENSEFHVNQSQQRKISDSFDIQQELKNGEEAAPQVTSVTPSGEYQPIPFDFEDPVSLMENMKSQSNADMSLIKSEEIEVKCEELFDSEDIQVEKDVPDYVHPRHVYCTIDNIADDSGPETIKVNIKAECIDEYSVSTTDFTGDIKEENCDY